MMETERNRSERGRAAAGELWDAVREGEAPSLASVWECPACGAQIQVLIAPAGIPRQPFQCVDGTPMTPGHRR